LVSSSVIAVSIATLAPIDCISGQRTADEVGAFDQQLFPFRASAARSYGPRTAHGLRGLLHLIDGIVH